MGILQYEGFQCLLRNPATNAKCEERLVWLWRETKANPQTLLIFYSMGAKRFRQSIEVYFVQDCVNATIKTFNFLIANDNVDFDYALAA